MSIMSITRFHVVEGEEAYVLELQSDEQRRVLAAEGCGFSR